MDNKEIIRYRQNLDKLLKQFERLKVKSYEYDENYFPKATKVRVYYNVSIQRPLWVLDPELTHRNKSYELQLIKHRDKAYRKVVDPIVEGMDNIKILKVYKIINRYIERQYELKKLQTSTWKHKEYTMYHATVVSNVRGICSNNFNWRLSGKSRGSKYGVGVSFTPNPDFSDQFCKSKNIKILFVAKVLIGTKQVGIRDQILPDDGFDTTQSPSGKVYVKFEDSEFCPEYVVYYNTKKC